MSNEGCFTFIFHHFVGFISKIRPYLNKNVKKGCLFRGTGEHEHLNFCLAVSARIFIYLFIWVFTSLSTLYRSYHDG